MLRSLYVGSQMDMDKTKNEFKNDQRIRLIKSFLESKLKIKIY